MLGPTRLFQIAIGEWATKGFVYIRSEYPQRDCGLGVLAAFVGPSADQFSGGRRAGFLDLRDTRLPPFGMAGRGKSCERRPTLARCGCTVFVATVAFVPAIGSGLWDFL